MPNIVLDSLPVLYLLESEIRPPDPGSYRYYCYPKFIERNGSLESSGGILVFSWVPRGL